MNNIYQLKIIFNEQKIKQIVITDHYQEKHSKIINDKLILAIIESKLNDKIIRADIRYSAKEVFVWTTDYQDKNYRLVFWYDNNDKSILWIRNCYPINIKSLI